MRDITSEISKKRSEIAEIIRNYRNLLLNGYKKTGTGMGCFETYLLQDHVRLGITNMEAGYINSEALNHLNELLLFYDKKYDDPKNRALANASKRTDCIFTPGKLKMVCFGANKETRETNLIENAFSTYCKGAYVLFLSSFACAVEELRVLLLMKPDYSPAACYGAMFQQTNTAYACERPPVDRPTTITSSSELTPPSA